MILYKIVMNEVNLSLPIISDALEETTVVILHESPVHHDLQLTGLKR